MRKAKKTVSFLDGFCEEDDDDAEDDAEDDDEDDDNKDTDKKKLIQKYEDKYKINKEIMDDELTQEKLEGLCNCVILENTPNGNALILYSHKTSSFIYYSDNSIPYKYLNTIARKYVNTYRCKQLYVNPEDELEKKEPDAKQDQETKESDAKEPDAKQDQETKESDIKESDAKESDTKKDQKKQIFAKFKTYNKNTTNKTQSQQQQQQQPHQSSQQQTQQQTQQPKQSQEVIANRYTHQGKIANFNFLKKPDKKLINKKLSLTFSDYKKLNISI